MVEVEGQIFTSGIYSRDLQIKLLRNVVPRPEVSNGSILYSNPRQSAERREFVVT